MSDETNPNEDIPVAGHVNESMTPFLSVYLDLVRFGAALVVILTHAWPILAPGLPLSWPGQDAVVVFFVLSGFVIAFVTDGRERTLRTYALRRAARIWSVAIPALVLSAAVTIAAFPPSNLMSDVVLPEVANLTFVGQLWTLDILPPLNGPFWSLNYEVWYYLIFGAWTYLRPPRSTLFVLVLACISGPKILLMFPCWLMGVWVYHHRPALSPRMALILFGASILAYLVLFKAGIPIAIRDAMMARWPNSIGSLQASGTFVGDYLLALVVAANFTAARSLGPYGAKMLAVRKPIVAAASLTFSMYLYHAPLLALATAVLRLSGLGILTILVVGIVVMGRLTEHNLRRVRGILERALPEPDKSPDKLALHL